MLSILLVFLILIILLFIFYKLTYKEEKLVVLKKSIGVLKTKEHHIYVNFTIIDNTIIIKKDNNNYIDLNNVEFNVNLTNLKFTYIGDLIVSDIDTFKFKPKKIIKELI
jgi:hypothetical protein